MRIGMLAPLARVTDLLYYEQWHHVVSLLVEGLRAGGAYVTVFSRDETGPSRARQSTAVDAQGKGNSPEAIMAGCLRTGELFERADDYDLIHSLFDPVVLGYCALTDTPVVVTVGGTQARKMLPAYRRYNGRAFYVALSSADMVADLHYTAIVHPGLALEPPVHGDSRGDYLFFLGEIDPQCGAGEACQIASQCEKDLLIAGPIRDRDYFRTQVEPFFHSGRIRYLGDLDRDRRIELLGGALALLHPTNADEAFCLPAVEANACGTPVIAFPRGSIAEIVSHGVNGFLVSDVPSAVEAVGQLRHISRADCRSSARERFSVERMVEDYLNVYTGILELKVREDHRPWGYYEVLGDKLDHKVKRIVLHPGRRLSYQCHSRRWEHWTVVSGAATVTLNDRLISLTPGTSVDIPRGAKHRVANPGPDPLVFIEVQMGDYFGEDDIQRFEDDFGRVPPDD